MRSVQIKLRNLSETLTFFSFALLLLCCAVSVKQTHAQDIPNTEEIKAVIAAPQRKKAVSQVKPKEAKSKSTATVLKNSALQSVKSAPVKIAPKSPVKELKPESYAVIRVSENGSAMAPVNGTVRLKQLNQGAAGVLVEAIRADTREMIASAETNAIGEFRFNTLPLGITLVFLVSSPNTKPLIFQTTVENGMKNLDFSVLPK